mgnify:CR=1 FL=1
MRWTNAVLPRGHRSVQRVIWLVQSGYTWHEPDDCQGTTARSDTYCCRKHGVGLVLASGSTAPNPPLRFKHRSVDLGKFEYATYEDVRM